MKINIFIFYRLKPSTAEVYKTVFLWLIIFKIDFLPSLSFNTWHLICFFLFQRLWCIVLTSNTAPVIKTKCSPRHLYTRLPWLLWQIVQSYKSNCDIIRYYNTHYRVDMIHIIYHIIEIANWSDKRCVVSVEDYRNCLKARNVYRFRGIQY